MDLSIIIVNYQGWGPLKICLDSLEETMKKADFSLEVIIVDNASHDGMLEKFINLYPSFRFFENDGNYGFSNGNNLGARYARGDFLLFLNPDTVVAPRPISSMLDLARQHPDFFILSSQQENPAGRKENPFGVFPSFWTINNIIRIFYLLVTGKSRAGKCQRKLFIFPDWVSGSVVLINRKVFDKLNGWDEDFWLYHEDVDLCRRARDAGGKVVLQCHPVIIHQHGGTTRKTVRLTAFFKTHVIISRHIYFSKHFTGLHLFLLQTFLVLNTLVLENLLPALAGLIFYPLAPVRKYYLLYINILKYYLRSIKNGSWFFDTKNVILPENKS